MLIKKELEMIDAELKKLDEQFQVLRYDYEMEKDKIFRRIMPLSLRKHTLEEMLKKEGK